MDELAKIAFGRTTVPPDIFARDLHEPSIKYEENGMPLASGPEAAPASASKASRASGPEASEVPEPEAMLVEGDQAEAIQEPDWRDPYMDCLVRGELPRIKPRLDGSRYGLSPLCY